MTIVRAAGRSSSSTYAYGVDSNGARGDWVGGTTGAGTNDTAAVQALINAAPAGATIQFTPSKTYRVDNLLVTKTLTIDGNGASIITRPTLGTAPFIWFRGTLGTPVAILAPSTSNVSVTCSTVGNAATFTVGDYVIVGDNPTLARWDGTTSVYAEGRVEINRVASVNTGTGAVGLETPVEWGYSSTPTITKVTMLERPVVQGFTSIQEIDPGVAWSGGFHGAVPHLIHFQHCVQPQVTRVSASNFNLHVVNFNACLQPVVSQTTARNPYRPSSGGHGYLMRFDQCTGGVARENVGHGVRHLVNWVNSYDCGSVDNLSINCTVSSYQTHGIYSKRGSSTRDKVRGGTIGWSIGNPEFADDKDFTIDHPSCHNTSTAIVARSKCDRLTVRNPDLHMATGGRGVHQCEGATRVTVEGGVIEIIGTSTSAFPVLARTRFSTGDAGVTAPAGLVVRGTLVVGAFQTLSLDVKGEVVVDGVIFDTPAMSATTSPLVAIGMSEGTSGVVPDGLRIANVVAATGTYQYGIRVHDAPGSTERYTIEGNHVTLASVTGGGITAPVADHMRLTHNRAASSGIALAGDAAAARTAGAVLKANFPTTYDG